ncbi:unnamed protein product [Didymodactylos carnosus]|uniref:Glycoside hydrolase family 3 N-terminal domain-containing protein n=1 Tax=Didymodactylos carnosus TaxID=1234261 RepID=A0A8S2SDI3_9BILA|nr:unnamed protein product [Didymodactylos carnosus]CAF4221550.1 unnamed protein product [Didymodactylos carnosus]
MQDVFAGSNDVRPFFSRQSRGQETPGEDPYLTSQYVYSIINGLQNDDDSKYLKIAASCKHFNAYDLENWNGTDCFSFNAVVTDQDLVETYLPPFETCIRDARVAGIMRSHNAINGIPSCANKFHLRTLARHAYHLNGFIVSDCGAIDNIMGTHHYTLTVQDIVVVALHAGTSLDCGDFYSKHSKDALLNGTISEQDIDKALQWNYETLLRLGWFDPPEQQVYRQYTKEQVNTKKVQQLALKSAQESIVLLKNNNDLQQLPINLNKLSGKRIGLLAQL